MMLACITFFLLLLDQWAMSTLAMPASIVPLALFHTGSMQNLTDKDWLSKNTTTFTAM